jgi:hypothetical protein
MLRMEHPDTNMASNQDWLRRSRDMTISAYDPQTTILNPAGTFGVGVVCSPFTAAHPEVAGRRNAVRMADPESITLGPAREIRPRQHANASTLLHGKNRK